MLSLENREPTTAMMDWRPTQQEDIMPLPAEMGWRLQTSGLCFAAFAADRYVHKNLKERVKEEKIADETF